MSTSSPRPLYQALVSAAALGIGALAFAGLLLTRPDPKRTDSDDATTVVDTVLVTARPHARTLTAYGTVRAAQEVTLVPEVAGKIVAIHPKFMPGARFERGDLLFRIDPRNYEAALQARSSDLERAVVEQELERGRRAVAQREWALFSRTEGGTTAPGTANDAGGVPEAQRDDEDPGAARALRVPQLKSATAAVNAAQSSLSRANLDLVRTRVSAPFAAVVLSENVDLGQVVLAGAPLARLVGTESFWVEVAVPVEVLPELTFAHDGAEGTPVTVHSESSDDRSKGLSAHVLQLLQELDPAGRMARLLVEIPKPFDLGRDAPPLLLGAYVRITLPLPESPRAFEIPRHALREGNLVWLMGPRDRLVLQPVSVIWRERDTLLVTGLPERARLITSRLPTPVAGLLLRSSERDTRPRDGNGAARNNAGSGP